jgi:membrane-associated phospholipid phosphatase
MDAPGGLKKRGGGVAAHCNASVASLNGDSRMDRSHLQEYRLSEAGRPWQARVGTIDGVTDPREILISRADSPTFVRAAALRRGIPSLRAAWGAFEWVAFGYLAVSSVLIATMAENLPHPLRLLGVQLLVACIIAALCRIEASTCAPGSHATTFSKKFWHFWRHWYPHLFFLFAFEELAHLVHLFTPAWQDAKLIAADFWLTGVQPAIWLEQFATPARNEFMQFAYFSYFTYLLVLGGILYHRKDWRGYWSVMTYSAMAYAIGYLIAISFPIESPWFAMAGSWHSELRGGPFTALINFIEHYGRVRGAAFPSEHVAGSFAALWGAWRHRRWLFWVMLPLVLCMCVSTVYGRYHYLVDVFGGMVTGTLGYFIGSWLMRKPRALPQTLVSPANTMLGAALQYGCRSGQRGLG